MAELSEDFKIVKDRVDLVSLIGETLTLSPKGQNYSTLCPWHDDSKPSLMIYPERQSYRCWVCNEGGDVYQFIEKREGISFFEAFQFLAHRVGHQIQSSPEQRQQWAEKDELYQIVADVADIYSKLINVKESEEYLTSRGVDIDFARDYKVGFAPDRWDFLTSRQSPSNLRKLEQVGLVKESEKRPGHFYDRFRGRIMFPIKDFTGRFVGFGGRTIIDDEAKYLNTPQTPIYDKSKVFYGLQEAQRAVRDSKELIIHEGYLDALLAHQHGVLNVAASCGTAFTDNQAEIVTRRFPDTRVILGFDGDTAGEKAALRASSKLIGRGNTDITLFGGNLDPADILHQHGKERYLEEIAKSTPLFGFYIDRMARGDDLTIPERGIAFLQRIAPDFQTVPPELKGIYIGVLATRMRQNRGSIESVLLNTPYGDLRGDKIDSRALEEFKLLQGLIGFPEARPEFADRVTIDTFRSPERRAVYEVVIQDQVAPGVGGLLEKTDTDPTEQILERYPGLDRKKVRNILFPSEERAKISLGRIESAYAAILAYDAAEIVFEKHREGRSLSGIERIVDNLEDA